MPPLKLVLVPLAAWVITFPFLWVVRSYVDPAPLYSHYPSTDEVVSEAVAAGATLEGRVAVVTGANTGIGLSTATALAKWGARVFVASRSEAKGAEAVEVVAAAAAESGRGGSAALLLLDLSSLRAVRASAERLREQLNGRLDIVINNAGYMPNTYAETSEGLPKTLGVNHVGHHLFTSMLLPELRGTPGSRVVTVASYGHILFTSDLTLEEITEYETPSAYVDGGMLASSFAPLRVYGNSKAANVLFAAELARREPNVLSYSVHPGMIYTEIGVPRVPSNGPLSERITLLFQQLGAALFWNSVISLKTPDQGAATQVMAAVSPALNAHSGAYLSDCAIAEPREMAQDPALSKALWDWTEEQIAKVSS